MTRRLLNHGSRMMHQAATRRRPIMSNVDTSRLRNQVIVSSTANTLEETPRHHVDVDVDVDFYATSSLEETLNQVLESQRLSTQESDPLYEKAVRSLVEDL